MSKIDNAKINFGVASI